MNRALVLAAHGSTASGYREVFESIADRIIGNRPDLDVMVGYLDHCSPRLAELPTAGTVIVPMLLSTGYHLSVDVPAAAPEAIVADAIGPDSQLMTVVAHRLTEAGWQPGTAVTLAAAGSSYDEGLADVRSAAGLLEELLDVEVTVAYAGAGHPALSATRPAAVATYLLAPGHFADVIAGSAAPVIGAPIGADPRVAEVAMRRYDAALPAF
jgi:sirohydrochlorin ferrochelatase